MNKIIVVTGLAALLAACASAPQRNDQLEQADKGGTAQRYAAADLQRAHDELADADRLSGQGKYDEARGFAQRAEVDADVAVARGNAMQQEKAAADVTQANNTLQQEIQRGDTNGPAHSN